MKRPGLLDKLLTIKSNSNLPITNVCLIKISSDSIIQEFTDKLISGLTTIFKPKTKDPAEDTFVKPQSSNIGLNKHVLFRDNSIINLYDYNYLLSKKYKYLKQEAIMGSTIFVFIINVHDNRGLQNMKNILDEIAITNKSISKCRLHSLLITQSMNLLLNLLKENQVDLIKNTFNLNSYTEVDFENIDFEEIMVKITS